MELAVGRTRNMPSSNKSANFICDPVTWATRLSPRVSGEPQPKEPLTLQVYTQLDDFRALEKSLEELMDLYPGASIFSSWDWLVSWWESFHNTQELQVIAGFDSDSHIVGLAALYISKERFLRIVPLRCLRFIGDGSGDSDNLDFLVRPGFEIEFASKFLEYLVQLRGQWQIARLNTVPRESVIANRLEHLLGGSRWTCFIALRECSSIQLPPAWDQYLSTLSSEDRKNIQRYRRRMEDRYSVRVYRCNQEHDLPRCLSALFRLHQMRWQKKGECGTFAYPERRQFYERLSLRLLAKNRLELWILELNSQITAVQFAMRYRDKVYQLQEGYDPGHSADRVGVVLRSEVLRQLISEGIRSYDFLGGVDQYKRRWGVTPGNYRDVTFANSWSIGSVVINSVHYARALKEWLRLHLPRTLWRCLHGINMILSKNNRF